MIFEGKVNVSGTQAKPKYSFTSKAFDVAKNASSATHLKLKDSNQFIQIDDNLIIKKKKDSNGNPTDIIVHYTQINPNEEFVCVIENKEFSIDSNFYLQIALMNKDEKGHYLKCNDGTFIHESEIQAPAYKKVPIYDDITLSKPVHNNEFYVEQEVIYIKDKTNPRRLAKVILNEETRKKVIQRGDKYFYVDGGEDQECYYKKNLETRQYIKHLLLNGDKVVDISKLKEKPNGDYIIENVEGENIVVGKKEIALEQDKPFVEGSTMEFVKQFMVPHNMLKQRQRIEQGLNLVFVWKVPTSNGLVRIDINRSRTWARFTYDDGRQEVYIQHGVAYHGKDGTKEIRVDKLDIVEIDADTIKVGLITRKNNIAQDLKFSPSTKKLTSYTLNDRKIEDIKWHQVDGYDSMLSYKIDGVLISDIVWENNEIKSCKVHLEDEFGNEVIKEISDMKKSDYRDLAITYKPTETIENVVTNGDKVSFKMGDYYFIDAELLGDNKIGKCTLKHNGTTEEIDNLSEDPRFKQLSLITKVTLDQSKVVPLIPSKLLNFNGTKYELEADIIQTEEMKEVEYGINGKPTEATKNNGVASAKGLGSVAQAIDEQKKFKNAPFKTIVIDEQNNPHVIDDFNTKYDVSDIFEQDSEIIPDKVGKIKADIKKGEIKIDDKADKGRIDNMVVASFMLCSNPLTLGIGIGMLLTTGCTAIGQAIRRNAKRNKLTNYSLKDFQEETQDNVADNCEKKINNLYAKFTREMNACKAKYSQKEYEKMAEEIRRNFRYECNKEIAKLQILGGGAIDYEFNPKDKVKLTAMNHLAFLEYQRLRKELENGKEDDPRLPSILARELNGITGDARILEEVKLLEQYGGRFSQQNAYAMKIQNINLFLDEENKTRAKDDKLSLEDFRKKLANEYDEGRLVWGSIDDKLEAYKNSIEYLREDPKTRSELLKARRETLEKEAQNVKVSSIKFNPRLDKNGNPVIEKYIQSIMAFIEIADEGFAIGDTLHAGKFTFDYYDKLSEEDKKIYEPTKTINDVTARKVNTMEMRKVAFASKVNENFVNSIRAEQRQVDAKVGNFAEQNAKHRAFMDYEHLYKMTIALDAEKEKFEQDCQNIMARIDNIPFDELNENSKIEAERELDEVRKQYAKQERLAEGAKKLLAKEYEWQVRDWALQEFAKRHKTEYEVYKRSVLRKQADKMTAEQRLIGFYDKMRENKDKRESYTREFETYKVKHHIEENVDAEAFCEVYADEYQKFIEDNKAQGLDEETARCYYYSHCKQNKPSIVDKFKTTFVKKSKEKAKERLKDGKLIKHEATEEVSQAARKTEVKTAEHSSAPAPEVSHEPAMVI